MSPDRLGLYDTPPNRRQIRVAIAIVGLLVAAALLIFPVSDVALPEISAFVPVINAVILVCELTIATLLYAQASVFRSRALAFLASGYVFVALLLIPHALTFPGAFAPNGLLGAEVNTTAWIGTLRRDLLPVAVAIYAVLNRWEAPARLPGQRAAWGIAGGVLAAIALAAAVTMLATLGHDLLPPLFVDRRETVHDDHRIANGVTLVLTGIAMAALFWQRRKSVLDLWLQVAMSAWLIQTLMNLPLTARFSLGFYSLFLVMLASALVVMLALLAESIRLYARLALSTAAQNREREARLLSMEAVAGAISQEVGQRLTAVVTSARAGLNLLDREQPEVRKAIVSLRDTLEAGNRGFEVIKSIRRVFGKRTGSVAEIDLNELVRETVHLLDRELAGGKVSLRLALDDTLPPILADRVQVKQVLVDLIVNAIHAMSATRNRARRISIRSGSQNDHVLLEVSDTGSGLARDEMAHIFDASYTTNSSGTGLGLSLCRTIVEEFGGRLWATPDEKHGATFHLQLPRSDFAGMPHQS